MLDFTPNRLGTTAQGREAIIKLQQESETLILVKFIGPHCSACKTLAPVLEQLVTDYSEKTHLVTVDMTEDPELAMEWGVRSVPTVIVLKGSSVLEKIVGLQPKKVYVEAIQKGRE
jgi:thioredoxin-like negative regulator of GroEL